jgi:hypothetical protein
MSFVSAKEIESILADRSHKMRSRSRFKVRTMADIAKLTPRQRHLIGDAILRAIARREAGE